MFIMLNAFNVSMNSLSAAEYERQDRLASLYFCPTSSIGNYAEGEDNLVEDCRRTSDTALAFQLSGSSGRIAFFCLDSHLLSASALCYTGYKDCMVHQTNLLIL